MGKTLGEEGRLVRLTEEYNMNNAIITIFAVYVLVTVCVWELFDMTTKNLHTADRNAIGILVGGMQAILTVAALTFGLMAFYAHSH